MRSIIKVAAVAITIGTVLTVARALGQYKSLEWHDFWIIVPVFWGMWILLADMEK